MDKPRAREPFLEVVTGEGRLGKQGAEGLRGVRWKGVVEARAAR